MDDVDSDDDILHEDSKIEQDVHAKEQVNGELLDEVEESGGMAARTQAEEAEEDDDENSEVEGDDEYGKYSLSLAPMLNTDSRFEVAEIVNHKFVKRVSQYHQAIQIP